MIIVVLTLAAAAQKKPSRFESIRAEIQQGRLDQAEQQLWAILGQDAQQPRALDLLGTIRLRQKRNAEAVALFRRVTTLQRDSAEAYRHLGEALVADEKPEEAIAAYSETVKLAPGDVQANYQLGSLLHEQGDFTGSLRALQAIPPAPRPSAALPIMAADYFGLKQPDKAGALIPIVVRRSARDPHLGPNFARVLIQNGFVVDAKKLLDVTQAKRRPEAEALYCYALIAEANGDHAKSEAYLQQALKLDPKNFDALYSASHLAATQEQWAEAMQLLGRANSISPNRPEVLRNLVFAAIKAHEPAIALQTAQQLNAARPGDPDAQYLLATAAVEAQNWQLAGTTAKTYLQNRPDDVNGWLIVTMSKFSVGEFPAAKQAVERSLQLDPHNVEAQYYAGLVAREEGDNAGAIAHLDRVVAAQPKHALALSTLGALYLAAGEPEKARLALETAIPLRPDLVENHYQLALAYARLGMAEKSRAEMEQFRTMRAESNQAGKPGTMETGDQARPTSPPLAPQSLTTPH
jgi:tetratricopeptide (TPR) repeat protein